MLRRITQGMSLGLAVAVMSLGAVLADEDVGEEAPVAMTDSERITALEQQIGVLNENVRQILGKLGNPVAVQPVQVKPVAVQPVQVKPVAVQPVQVAPVAVQPVNVKPVQVQPVQVQPIHVTVTHPAPSVSSTVNLSDLDKELKKIREKNEAAEQRRKVACELQELLKCAKDCERPNCKEECTSTTTTMSYQQVYYPQKSKWFYWK